MRLFISSIIIIFSLTFCTSSSNKQNTGTSKSLSSSTHISIKEKILSFKPQEKPYILKDLSVQTFLKVNLSHLENQILISKALLKGYTIPKDQQSSIEDESLDKNTSKDKVKSTQQAKDSFFAQWGITQDQFAQFSITNQNNIKLFLSQNKKIEDRLLYLESLLSQIQEEATSHQEYDNIGDNLDTVIDKTSNLEDVSHE